MSNAITTQGLTAIRLRDRRRVRRAPSGAIGFIVNDVRTVAKTRPDRLIDNDDVRQFLMSFAAFFTAAMIFLA